MKTEQADALLLDEHIEFTLAELAELSGLAPAQVGVLVDYGVLTPLDPQAAQWHFSAGCVVSVRTACRLRDDFGLDDDALALALRLVERIRELEDEMRALRAQMPQRPR